MSRVVKSEIVTAFCQKHKMCEHIEYTRQDGTKKYVCRFCKSDAPYQYPVYGRQSPKLDMPQKEKQTYGRIVA